MNSVFINHMSENSVPFNWVQGEMHLMVRHHPLHLRQNSEPISPSYLVFQENSRKQLFRLPAFGCS
jgi:hypothetical protein